MPTTFQADSGALADWQSKEAVMTDGDTLEIPDFDDDPWDSYFETSKAINIVSRNGSASTIIRFGRVGSSLHFLFNLNSADKATRMSGFGFADGGSTGGGYGFATFGGGFGNPGYDQRNDLREFRMDHCKFDHLPATFAVVNANDTLGVLDHNEFLLKEGQIGVYTFHRNWRDAAGNAGPYAGGSWSGPTEFGTRKFLFIQDNIFTADAPRGIAHDSYGGGRTVFRWNTCTRILHSVHGTETGGLPRGGRAFEIYENDWIDCESAIIDIRSGIVLAWGNRSTGTVTPVITLDNDRTRYPYLPAPGATADGTSRYDINEPGGPFYSGTATGGTINGGVQGQATVTVTGADWDPDEWVGHSVVRTSFPAIDSVGTGNPATVNTTTPHGITNGGYVVIEGNTGSTPDINGTHLATVVDADTLTIPLNVTVAGTGGTARCVQVASYILDNTTDTITFLTAVDNPAVNTMLLVAGDTFDIFKVNEAIDSPGRALGSWIEDMSAGLPVDWNDQVTEKCYSFDNRKTEDNSEWGFSPGPYGDVIREGEHFANSTQMPAYTPYGEHPLLAGDPPESPPMAPQFTDDPEVTGTPEVGETVETDDGTVTGSPTPTITYQWYRCSTP